MSEYVFDAYALFEILHGNSSYHAYTEQTPIVNPFILGEYCHGLLKEMEYEKAHRLAHEYEPFSQSVDVRLMLDASTMKRKYSKQNLSFTDCIGYLHAKKMGVKFLTGDKQFEHMENVEFVK
jgi:predicted nucleic acid-binding protein